MRKVLSFLPVALLLLPCVLLVCQQSISAQTFEDMLEKAKKDIGKAQESGLLGGVSILSNSSYIDSIGILHVVGEVFNDMALHTAEDVQVIATFYDSTGKVVGTSSGFTNPRNIASEEKAPFNISLTSASIPLDKIGNYTVIVNWR